MLYTAVIVCVITKCAFGMAPPPMPAMDRRRQARLTRGTREWFKGGKPCPPPVPKIPEVSESLARKLGEKQDIMNMICGFKGMTPAELANLGLSSRKWQYYVENRWEKVTKLSKEARLILTKIRAAFIKELGQAKCNTEAKWYRNKRIPETKAECEEYNKTEKNPHKQFKWVAKRANERNWCQVMKHFLELPKFPNLQKGDNDAFVRMLQGFRKKHPKQFKAFRECILRDHRKRVITNSNGEQEALYDTDDIMSIKNWFAINFNR